jgi:hypothetical protein
VENSRAVKNIKNVSELVFFEDSLLAYFVNIGDIKISDTCISYHSGKTIIEYGCREVLVCRNGPGWIDMAIELVFKRLDSYI